MSSALTLSLVVLSFNRFETTTGPCLASLLPALDNPRIELILVDNGSSDDAPARCRAWATEHPRARYLPLPRNLGFAGGMNEGVGVAGGEWICLVNSDTLFPAGALDALLTTLARVPSKVAMVGPVTNAAGNGQCLPMPETPLQRIVDAGARAMRAPTGLLTPSYRTDFFCVAIRRSVWQQLDGLDTRFGLGYYEDFDFSLRMRALGREQVIAEDVFVAHAGSASFSVTAQAQKTLMRRNRALLIKQHPQVQLEPVRAGNASALIYLLSVAQASGWTDALRLRASWRLAALQRDEPRSPFKRLRWRWKTRDLRRALRDAGIAPQFPDAAPFDRAAPPLAGP